MYSVGKTNGVLRGGASRANRCYVLAQCAGGGGNKYAQCRKSPMMAMFFHSKEPKTNQMTLVTQVLTPIGGAIRSAQ